MEPLPVSEIGSSKVAVSFAHGSTLVASSAGLTAVMTGGMNSGGSVVKFQVVSSVMPSKAVGVED